MAQTSPLGDRLFRGDSSIFTELLEILDEAVTIRDRDGQLLYANRAALEHLGIESLAELQSRSSRSIMDDYVVEDELGQPLTHDDVPSVRLMQDKPAPPLLMRVVNRSSGEVRWNLLKATEIRGADSQFLGAMTVIEDVTAVKTAEVRTRVLAESGLILASSLDYQQTLRNLANVAVPALADWCVVDLVDTYGRRERVVAAHRDATRQRLAKRLEELEPDELQPGRVLTRVFRRGTSELCPDVSDEQLALAAHGEEHLGVLRELGVRSVAIVPMRVPSRTIGLMTLATAESRRRLTDEDVALAEQLGRRAAVAVDNSRLHTTLARVAETLQQSLLPGKLPDIPGWEAAALYRPVDTEQRIEVGGDFYELFQNAGSWFAIVGDVAGKGVTAASLTALMRHGARVASRSEPRPAAILARLNEALREHSEGALCTALCLRLFQDHVVISSAGHPPAMLVGVDGTVREDPAPGPLLGAFDDAQRREQTVPVGRDELVFLYTDGVVETLGPEDRFGVERLARLLSEHAGDRPRKLLADLDATLDSFRSGPRTDDVAAVALRPRR